MKNCEVVYNSTEDEATLDVTVEGDQMRFIAVWRDNDITVVLNVEQVERLSIQLNAFLKTRKGRSAKLWKEIR